MSIFSYPIQDTESKGKIKFTGLTIHAIHYLL